MGGLIQDFNPYVKLYFSLLSSKCYTPIPTEVENVTEKGEDEVEVTEEPKVDVDKEVKVMKNVISMVITTHPFP